MRTLPAIALAILLSATLTPDAQATTDAFCRPGGGPSLPHPILFVAQVPIAADFATIGSTFANHFAGMEEVARGGDLYLRYGDGTLCNLTREAGYGVASAHQGPSSIAVRDPDVHWSGRRALFSMVVGAPAEQYEYDTWTWQIYEVKGMERGAPVQIRRVAGQPRNYNNVSPVYTPDGRIVFASDRPRNGRRHLYPQHDEYESTATVTGLWSLAPRNGNLRLLNHAPSGAFTPIVDSFGRVLFTRWDHLQRDQQADADALEGDIYGTFDYAGEGKNAARLPRREEVFPEPRDERKDLLAGTPFTGHSFNSFLPWEIRPDGTGEETLNHVGRHDLLGYFDRARNDDPRLVEFIAEVTGRTNPREIESFFQIAEDPTRPGVYYGVDAPEFGTHAAGQIVRVTAPPDRRADRIEVTYVTHRDTSTFTDEGETPPATHSGHYRDPMPTSDGRLVASHAEETRYAENEGTRAFPEPRHHFALRLLEESGGVFKAGPRLTDGIVRTVRYWDPDVLVEYSGPLWELSPVEVRRRPKPPLLRDPGLEGPEAGLFAREGVDPAALRKYLRKNGLALIVSRNVTTRDAADRQQPFNLRVVGGGAETVATPGRAYDVAYLQLFQGDQVRGIGGIDHPEPGRRVLARPLHGARLRGANPPSKGPAGSVVLESDGSMAAFVPARRALTWQLTDPSGEPVVRERYWVTFQPGEIRVCTSCHGLSSVDQKGRAAPSNPPQALRRLLRYWQKSQAD